MNTTVFTWNSILDDFIHFCTTPKKNQFEHGILLVEEYDSSGYLDLLLSFRGIPIIALKRVRIEHFRHRFSLLFGPKFLCKYHPLIGGEPQRFWPKVVSLCLGRPVEQTIVICVQKFSFKKYFRLVLKSYGFTYCCQDMNKILDHFIKIVLIQIFFAKI